MSLENEDMHEIVPDIKEQLELKNPNKEKEVIHVDADEVLKPMKSNALILK